MYKKPFFIDQEIGNNAFSFQERKHKQIYVPNIIDITDLELDKIQLQSDNSKVAFEDFGFDDKLSTNYGLKNFYKISSQSYPTIYLFDNHNHAYYFWYDARSNGLIWDDNLLVHVDEHADMRDPKIDLLKPESENLQKVFDFCNFSDVNVGNYIIPAQREGIIGNIIQIRNDTNLDDYLENPPVWENIVLNLDLDFFQPDLDFIDYEKKKQVVLDAASKAKVITICTSPFFINQELALDVFFDIFYKK